MKMQDIIAHTAIQDAESVHIGEADPQDVAIALKDPRAFLRGAGVKMTEDSEIKVTLMQRDDRHAETDTKFLAAAPTVAEARSVIIIIHYACCCGEIIILGSW